MTFYFPTLSTRTRGPSGTGVAPAQGKWPCVVKELPPFTERLHRRWIFGQTKRRLDRYNEDRMLFSQAVLGSKKGYYIPNFSGKAFELLLANTLEDHSQLKLPLFKKIKIFDHNYELQYYWDAKIQIDLLLSSPTDRLLRIFECKWVGEKLSFSNKEVVSELVKKKAPNFDASKTQYFLFLPEPSTLNFEKWAQKQGVSVLSTNDLF